VAGRDLFGAQVAGTDSQCQSVTADVSAYRGVRVEKGGAPPPPPPPPLPPPPPPPPPPPGRG